MSTSADRVRVLPRAFDHPDVLMLIEAIQQTYLRLYGNRDDDQTRPAEFAPPHGAFFVAYLAGPSSAVPVGCGGWRRREPGVGEIKRMYVTPEHRGRGVARLLLAELEASAAAAGCTRLVLNTGFRQVEAIGLYESSGYRRGAERYGFYADISGAFFFAKELPRARAQHGPAQNAPQPAPGTRTGGATEGRISRG